jgi:hypothetical protein
MSAARPRGRTAHRTYRAWTLREEQRLRDLWAQGWSVAAIAGELDRSVSSVANRRHERALPGRATKSGWPPWTARDDDRLRAGWAQGWTARRIAGALHRTEAAVWQRRKMLDLPPRYRRRRRQRRKAG